MTNQTLPSGILEAPARGAARRVSPSSAHRAAGAVALAGVLALSCATSGVNRGDFNLISLEEEWELGAQLARDLEQKLDLVKDGRAVRYLNEVGNAIVRRTELAQAPWEFHLVNDPAINAFNIPGGHVYVYKGLVEAAPDAAAFAGVLAHEIGHGVARHGTEQLSKSYGLSVLGGVLLGRNPAVYEQILAQILAGGAIAKFSRADEREADELGVRYSHQAGYDPLGLARMLEVLLDQRRRSPGRVESFFATHPATEERIADTRQMAAALEGGRRNDPAFDDFQRVAARAN
ncbi:MAG TPA: M48 family metallopeptidase [Thermoanaerobaculia bacterium]|nr:M48 family metallopeptidase [Thermoanaerobaculia bacterium]